MDVPALGNKPELDCRQIPILNAFNFLSATRTYGYGTPNPLQPSEIVTWLEFHGLHPNDRVEWFSLITTLDRAWIMFQLNEAKKDANAPTSH